VLGQVLASGVGLSKQEAERQAAGRALENLATEGEGGGSG
jgi:dsRNA-specific ribonuclease